MRRIKILFYWLFNKRNNISFIELILFLLKPRVKNVGNRYIKEIVNHIDEELVSVSFKTTNKTLYWPQKYPVNQLYQISAETFDKKDWHYYQKKHTEVVPDEVLVDVGTAEGLFALTVVEKCKKIILLEPSKAFCISLKKTFHSYEDKVSIRNVAVGKENAEISFKDSSICGQPVDNKRDGYTIQMKTLDTVLQEEEKITFLKADIEGFELEMLKGACETIKKHKPKIAITCYHEMNDPDTIISFVKVLVPDYNYYVKGVAQWSGKPVMIHFWI